MAVDIKMQGRDFEQKSYIENYCKKNNFEIGEEWTRANIQWLSNSSTVDLPLDQWFFRYILFPYERHKFSRHSRMEFGKYVDEYAGLILTGQMTIAEAIKKIKQSIATYIPSTADKTDQIRIAKYLGQVEGYINQVLEALVPIAKTYEEVQLQYPVVLILDGINIPFIGYLDFAFLNNGKLKKWVELKTMWDNPGGKYKKDYYNKATKVLHKAESTIWKTQSLPKTVLSKHSPQLAIYSIGTNVPGDILYCKENEHILFEADSEFELQMPYHQDSIKSVIASARVRQNLLKLAHNPENLFHLIEPNFTHWKWQNIEPEYLKQAKELWLGGNNDQEK